MKKLLAGSVLAMAITGFVASAQAATVTYGWEDDPANLVLGTYNSTNLSTFLEDDSSYVRSGQYSLGLTDASGSTTPQAYVGWVTGLQNQDQVTAGFWVYDKGAYGSGTSKAPAARIWGHYTNDHTDIDSFLGGAVNDTNSPYSTTGWSYQTHTWTINSTGGATGLVIEVRTYDITGQGDAINTLYIDDLTITAPDHATIITAGGTTSPVPVPGSALLLGAALTGLGALRRRSA